MDTNNEKGKIMKTVTVERGKRGKAGYVLRVLEVISDSEADSMYEGSYSFWQVAELLEVSKATQEQIDRLVQEHDYRLVTTNNKDN